MPTMCLGSSLKVKSMYIYSCFVAAPDVRTYPTLNVDRFCSNEWWEKTISACWSSERGCQSPRPTDTTCANVHRMNNLQFKFFKTVVTTHQRRLNAIVWLDVHINVTINAGNLNSSSECTPLSFVESKIKYNVISGNINYCWNPFSSYYIPAAHLMHFLAYVSQNKIDNKIKIAFLRDFNAYRKNASGSFYRFTKQKHAHYIKF